MISNDTLCHPAIGIRQNRVILSVTVRTAEEEMAQSIVIVGAGLCGGRAALGLRDRGFDGQVTLIGSEAHAPYDRPPLSKNLHVTPELKLIAEAEVFAAGGIQHLAGRDAVAIDRARH